MNLPSGWPGYLVGLLGLIFPFVVSWRRGRIDESALVLAEWRKLYEAHEKRIEGYEAQITRLTSDFDRHREESAREREASANEIAGLRNRLRTAEERIAGLEQSIREKDKHITGLEAQLRQNSQSTAHMLGRPDGVADSKAVRKEPRK